MFFQVIMPQRFVSVCVHAQLLNHVRLFATLWTVACQAPLSMVFFRQEYWSELPFPFPGDLPDPGTEPISPALASKFFTNEPPGKPLESKWEFQKIHVGN